MIRNPHPPPADACAPDTDRAGTDAPARLPEWVVHLIALVIRFILERALAARTGRAVLPAWWNYRPDLPAGSMQQLAASRRGAFGNAIAWMCLRRGIGPDHPDWPYLARTIVAFGGSLEQFRPGLPAVGLQWWENPNVIPGVIADTVRTPAADAVASLLTRQAVADAPPPAAHGAPARLGVTPSPALRRRVFVRAGTGPPTGPPLARGLSLMSCLTHGAAPRLVPPS